MCYAAKYPNDISQLVIEDMDIRRRSVDSNFIQNFDEVKAISFERGHATLDSLKKDLENIGYPVDMYSKWIDEGRIYEEKSENSKHKFWSDVNPAFRALCYRTIFDSNSGSDSWDTIARNMKEELESGNEINNAKVHVMVAGIGTVCEVESLNDMRNNIPDPVLSMKTYSQGTHSIHNSVRDEFMTDLEQIICSAKNVRSKI